MPTSAVPTAPIRGVYRSREHPNLWVVDKEMMTAQRRGVTTGDLTGEANIQITEGLKSGEMVAVSGVSQIREGMKVKPFHGTF